MKLAKTFMMGKGKYPTSTSEAYSILLNWQDESATTRASAQHDDGNMTSHQNDSGGGNIKENKKKDHLELLCYRCGQYEEHYANEYPYIEDEAEKMNTTNTG